MPDDIARIVADYILTLPPYPKGREWREEEEIVRLSANENPLGPSPRVIEAIGRSLKYVHRYPDGTGMGLRRRLADKWEVSPDEMILGNGSDEIFELVVKACLRPGEEVIVPDPTFAYYRIAAQSAGARCTMVPLRDLRIDLDDVAAHLGDSTRLVFLCNPNNPTGTMFTDTEFRDFMALCPSHVVVVVDEAYGDYVEDPRYPRCTEYLRWGRWVVTTKTFSKFYALAGLRIGYGIAPKELVTELEKIRQPFSVNLPALVAAQAALADESHARATATVNTEGKRTLYKELSRLGIRFISSEANFILVNLGEAGSEVVDALLQHGIVIRNMKGYGLDGYARITIGLPEENERLVGALETWQKSR